MVEYPQVIGIDIYNIILINILPLYPSSRGLIACTWLLYNI